MREYIDKGNLYDAIVRREEEYRSPLLRERNYNTPNALQMQGLLNATTLIKHMVFDSPAADVVEVVRCKDCKHCMAFKDKSDGFYGHCRIWLTRVISNYAALVDADGYCSYGKRKEG